MSIEPPSPRLPLPLLVACAVWAAVVYAAYLVSYVR
jgi:hypothetical protein